MLARIPRVKNDNVLMGFETSDDAGVYKLTPECALVQTVDFFTPIVDDPFTFGAIAAANSLSDVYAMGGRPISPLSIVAYPGKGDLDDLEAILAKAEADTARDRWAKARAGVDSAKANIKALQAAVEHTEVLLEFSLIRAPFDGVVLTKNADVGEVVAPFGASSNSKGAVVTMADMASLQVEADVSESNLGKVRVGAPCEIQLDALPENRFRGRVHTIVPTADRSKATVMVKVGFVDKDSRVLPEMSAKVAFLERPVAQAEEKPLTAVSPSAVATRDGRTVVFLVKGNRVAAIPVVLGEKVGSLVEVKSGVKAGEVIAVKPLEKLKDGARIRTAEK